MVRIITDSTSDLTLARARELNIDILPLQVLFGQETFWDGVDLSGEEFYARLTASEELPTTSQINPDTFHTLFQKYADQGDQIVGIFISSQLSGTCQSAMIAKSMVDEGEIHIIDSRTVTFALGLLVEEAVAMRDRGLPAAVIAEKIEALSHRVRLLAAVDTLLYLKKGGRISATTAVVGGLLGINPIIAIGESGVVESVGKARGMKAAFRWIADRISKTQPADTRYRIAFGHTNSPAALAACMNAVKDVVPTENAMQSFIGAVVGTHAGPGAAGIAYIAAEETHIS